jgi:hypothetical protein
MNQDSGITVGIIPEEWMNKLIIIGNSSGLGSVMVASNPSLITKYQQLIQKVKLLISIRSHHLMIISFNICHLINIRRTNNDF